MFKQRLLTTIFLVPLVLAVLFYAPSWILAALVFIIFLACGWEWIKLIPLKGFFLSGLFLIALIVSFFISGKMYFYWLIPGLLLWGLILLAIVTYPYSLSIWGRKTLVAGLAIILLPLFAHSLINIYLLPQGVRYLVYLLALIWAADIGAYLTGKQWGSHKCIPKVSPGKSWEGISGGLFFALLVSLTGYYFIYSKALILWLGLALLTALISILGDLFISILKRRCSLKDTGALLPGHGGILDRLDSLIAAAPFYYFGLLCLLEP